MKKYISLLITILFNGYSTLYAHPFKSNNSLSSTPQLNETIQSSIDNSNSVSLHNMITTLNNNSIIVFFVLLIILGVCAFTFRRYINRTTRNKADNKSSCKIEWLNALLDIYPMGIWILSKEGILIDINKNGLELIGVSDINSIRGLSFKTSPTLPEVIKDAFARRETIETNFSYDFSIINKLNYYKTSRGSETVHIKIKGEPIFNANGQFDIYIFVIEDITEKHKADLILKESEHNLKLALEAGNVDAWSYDIKSQNFNPLGSHCSFGLDTVHLDYENMLICADDISKRDEIMNDIIQGKINKGKTILRYKTNPQQDQYRYYETRITAKIEDGIVVALTFSQRDITDKHLLELEKENSQKKIKFAIDSAELTLWEYDAIRHVFTSHNNALLDLNPAECLSIDAYIKHLNTEKNSDAEFRNIISCMNQGIDKSYTIDIKVKEKSKKNYDWSHYTIENDLFEVIHDWTYYTIEYSSFEKDESGRVTKYVGYVKDNTKWIALGKTLTNLNTQLKTVLSIGNIYPFICEITNNKFRFTATSPIGETNIFPVALNTELTLEQVLSAFDAKDMLGIENILLSMIRGDISEVATEIRWNSDFQNTAFYELNMSTLRDKDFKGSLKLIGYLQDITKHNQMVSDLQKAKQEAEKATKLKSAFLANMSHEIRTPLNAIIGFSELLIDEDDEATKAEYLGIISTNNDLLLKLISDILDLSKIDAGITDFNLSVFDFTQFFNELHRSMLQRIEGSAVTLSVTNSHSKCLVNLDKNRLAQVCINYITNAIKYTPKGSINMGYEVVNGGIRLYVKDTGIGIAIIKQHKVFQRFEKLDDFAQGTGLGLSITKALVESMNGEVGFESEEGVGSTFWAWIPCNILPSQI